ncbi:MULTISPECIES: serine hydrolase [Allobacillus]|uniref:Beta-lactamase family protein n=1 Tax=Allobacillus salarius TaxID=1955272 RepID=A0A556PDT4_9BACI|nr:serine hydrolase domain-containing protein [Allobacillus salarius]TSJ62556.1 beta-lactamase family protein [Allobacillus salarius]
MVHQVIKYLDQCIENRKIPGYALAVVDSDQTILEAYNGVNGEQDHTPINIHTVFDLASLTKVTATLPVILKLIEQEKIQLDDSINNYFSFHFSREISVKELLQHSSGLQAFYPFHHMSNFSKDAIIQKIIELESRTETSNEITYSDLNFILLGLLAENITGKPLDVLADKIIFEPLEMNHTCFNPSLNLSFAATEWDSSSEQYIQGKVHDENARHMDGVAGHAGLFSTLTDMKKYAQAWLKQNDDDFLAETTRQFSIETKFVSSNQARGLGWQFNKGVQIAGEQFSDWSFGHTGFTGTSIWFDDSRKKAVILLTNRVHYGRENSIASLRKEVHNLVFDSLSN